MDNRRTLSGYPLFFGEPGEDADLFLADFRMALHINHIHDVGERLGMFRVVLRKDADVWFRSLPIGTQGDLDAIFEAFQTQYGQAPNTQKLWKDITLLKQRGIDDYLSYRQEFLKLWTLWLRSLQNPGDGVEFLKKERFIAGLVPQLRLKVEAGEPATYQDAERRAFQKYKKLKCLEGEASLRDEMVDARHEAQARTRVTPARVSPEVTIEAIERLNESLQNLSIHFAQAIEPRGVAPRPTIPERENRPCRVLHC